LNATTCINCHVSILELHGKVVAQDHAGLPLACCNNQVMTTLRLSHLSLASVTSEEDFDGGN
jgi:formate-dependent nitrite reductase cytochrome c552 subunit